MLTFGCCGGRERGKALLAAGFDFIEPPADAAFASEPFSLPSPVFNRFIPGKYSIFGGSQSDLENYVQQVLAAVAHHKGEIVVFGSGTARRRPDDLSPAAAMDTLLQFCRKCAVWAEKWNLTIAIEHLNHKECNVLTTAREAALFAEQVGHENFTFIVDSYHMLVEEEPVSAIAPFARNIGHVHLADGEGRTYPHKDKAFYQQLGELLHSVGYQGRISVEGRINDYAVDGPKALAVMKEFFQ